MDPEIVRMQRLQNGIINAVLDTMRFPMVKKVFDDFIVWTIYEHPKDYPDRFVARLFTVTPEAGAQPTKYHLLADSLEEIRNLLPPGLVRIERDLADEPQIVERWI